MQNHFSQNYKFDRQPNLFNKTEIDDKVLSVQKELLDYILKNIHKNDPQAIIEAIDKFGKEHWMMNLGSEKGEIITGIIHEVKPKNVLELGGYCGYPGLVFASHCQAQIHRIEPNEEFIDVSRQLHDHAGINPRVAIHEGFLSALKHTVLKLVPFDIIYMNHLKNYYLQDFKLLEEYGAIKKGTVIIADGIIYPGAPDYLEHMKQNSNYKTTIYYSYVSYSDIRDAMLVSIKL